MKCPKCGGMTTVKDTRHTKDTTMRMITCKDCGRQYFTQERIVVDRDCKFIDDWLDAERSKVKRRMIAE